MPEHRLSKNWRLEKEQKFPDKGGALAAMPAPPVLPAFFGATNARADDAAHRVRGSTGGLTRRSMDPRVKPAGDDKECDST
jgi:hypothetical protein